MLDLSDYYHSCPKWWTIIMKFVVLMNSARWPFLITSSIYLLAAGMLMDLISPLFPSAFVFIVCLGSLSRSFSKFIQFMLPLSLESCHIFSFLIFPVISLVFLYLIQNPFNPSRAFSNFNCPLHFVGLLETTYLLVKVNGLIMVCTSWYPKILFR